jgi:hypothetical protein
MEISMKTWTIPMLQKEFIRIKKDEEALLLVLEKMDVDAQNPVVESFRKDRSALGLLIFGLLENPNGPFPVLMAELADVDFGPTMQLVNLLQSKGVDLANMAATDYLKGESKLSIYLDLLDSADEVLDDWKFITDSTPRELTAVSTAYKKPKPIAPIDSVDPVAA